MTAVMSFSKLDIQVIDESLLIQCIHPHDSELDANRMRELSHSQFNLVDEAPKTEELYLSFRKILKIENLVAFDCLKKLCIDNNLIEEIASIGHLKNLRWLDLSFNNIRKIQGLDSLVNLEDLSLFSNKITVIEGLDNCANLKCLSLGNNRIESLDQIHKLRQLKSLKVLTMTGNPVCKSPDYRVTVLAYIDTLKYLDYGLVYEDERGFAIEQFHDILLDVIEKESIILNEKASDKIHENKLRQLEEAGILFAHTLFDDIFAFDSDLERLKHLPGVREMIEQFRKEYTKLSDEFIKLALEQHDKRSKEMQVFEHAVKNIRTHDDADSSLLINGFFSSKKSSLSEINEDTIYAEKRIIIDKLEQELTKVCDNLMNIEVHQGEKFESIIDDFDNRLVDIKARFLDMQQAFFRNVEELEKKYYDGVRSIASDLVDRQSSNLLPADFLDDDALTLVIDRETCMLVVQSSHESHLGRILKREDEARSMETKRYHDITSKYISEERRRNRDRILQIHEFSIVNKEKLSVFHTNEDDDGYDDDDHIHK